MKPKGLIKLVTGHGWQLERIRGSHYIFKHPNRVGRLTIPLHNTDLKPGTLNQILKDAGMK